MAWRRFGTGAAAAMAYIAAAALSWPSSGLVLYDAFWPALPYRWVHPPAETAKDNQPAQADSGVVPLGQLGLSQPRVVQTQDAQMQVTFPAGVVAIQSGATSVRVTIIPLDPSRGARPPTGLLIEGNLYRVEARYAPSGEPVALAGPVTVVIRYPRHAEAVLHSAGAGWAVLRATRYPGTLQVLANSDELGVFAAATPGGRALPEWLPYAAAAGANGRDAAGT